MLDRFVESPLEVVPVEAEHDQGVGTRTHQVRRDQVEEPVATQALLAQIQRGVDQELMRTRGVQMESWGGFAGGKNNLFTDPLLTEIGHAHGKTVAQVVLRWLIQRDIVTISKSVRRERMEQNLDVFDFALSDEDMSRIATMDTGASLFFYHRDPSMVSWLNSRKGI
jgi:diketogulonate reductase-like aldo/keto reductase